MFILVKNNKFIVGDQSFDCALGINGLTENKKEGDGCTPIGTFRFNKIFYREDRLGKLNFLIDSSTINFNDGWCDDTKSAFYNQHIRFPFNESAENLFREDNIYDLICVLNYNTKPIISGKGSAIFLHIARKDFIGTEGCVAIEKAVLINITKNITSQSQIKISF